MLEFARFADGSAPLSELEDYFAERVKQMLRPSAAEPGPNHTASNVDEQPEGVS